MAMLFKFLVVFIIVKLSSSHTAPIRCEDLNIPPFEKNDLCWKGLYVPRQASIPAESLASIDFQEVQRRNSELSSALNFLYGNKREQISREKGTPNYLRRY
ncbi:hypothetical protein NQ317_005170 [Molorchus minor]|uniref:Uncharacterized protein n=1 Tax=Molorchus minor TaxID=1323400 RepID=A0ABQ9JDT1_9CUCU|nr:hypothetical protein NQ317_005170 [Molorchus minor]